MPRLIYSSVMNSTSWTGDMRRVYPMEWIGPLRLVIRDGQAVLYEGAVARTQYIPLPDALTRINRFLTLEFWEVE